MNILKQDNSVFRLSRNILRFYSTDSPQGIKCHGFTYYPRFPDHKDPPYEPAKAFLLKKIIKVKGTSRDERTILKQLKLDGKMSEVALIKNTPQNNSKLWKIKHLIRITPVTFPNGEPTLQDAECPGATFLSEHGELTIKPSLQPTQPQKLLPPSKLPGPPGGETMRRHLRLKWLSGMY